MHVENPLPNVPLPVLLVLLLPDDVIERTWADPELR
jgi:hypothetical protein